MCSSGSRDKARVLRLGGGLALVAALALLPPWLAARQDPPEKASQAVVARSKKLVLKDGSFHLVRSYERKGDRVRYYSVERSVWEEIPADLVDWEATRRAEAETEQHKQEMIEKMKAAEMAALAREIDVDASIEIAPGVFMPDDEGLYLLDGRAVLPLAQVGADLKRDKGRLLTQILVPIPVIPTKHKVEIAGKRAVFRISSAIPEFYMRTADAREPEIELIRARVRGSVREIQVVYTDVTGQQATEAKTISIQRWKLAKGVYRLTMSQSLEPGEYALAEFLPGEGMNLYVWDFGVDPAPAPQPAKP